MGDFFYPDYNLTIGGSVITEGVRLELQLDDEVSFDWMIITWTEKLINSISINIEDSVSLNVGYGGLTQIFFGTVTKVEDLQVIVKNEMLKMNKTKIINSFLDCTPEDVLTYVLRKAGIDDFEIGGENLPTKKLYNVSNMTAMEVLKDIDRFFQLNPSTNIFNNKKFEWNVKPSQGSVNLFVYAQNIISLVCIREKYWELETVLVTDIKVLYKIAVDHPKVSGTFTVKRIKYFIDENGFVRVKLQFAEE